MTLEQRLIRLVSDVFADKIDVEHDGTYWVVWRGARERVIATSLHSSLDALVTALEVGP